MHRNSRVPKNDFYRENDSFSQRFKAFVKKHPGQNAIKEDWERGLKNDRIIINHPELIKFKNGKSDHSSIIELIKAIFRDKHIASYIAERAHQGGFAHFTKNFYKTMLQNQQKDLLDPNAYSQLNFNEKNIFLVQEDGSVLYVERFDILDIQDYTKPKDLSELNRDTPMAKLLTVSKISFNSKKNEVEHRLVSHKAYILDTAVKSALHFSGENKNDFIDCTNQSDITTEEKINEHILAAMLNLDINNFDFLHCSNSRDLDAATNPILVQLRTDDPNEPWLLAPPDKQVAIYGDLTRNTMLNYMSYQGLKDDIIKKGNTLSQLETAYSQSLREPAIKAINLHVDDNKGFTLQADREENLYFYKGSYTYTIIYHNLTLKRLHPISYQLQEFPIDGQVLTTASYTPSKQDHFSLTKIAYSNPLIKELVERSPDELALKTLQIVKPNFWQRNKKFILTGVALLATAALISFVIAFPPFGVGAIALGFAANIGMTAAASSIGVTLSALHLGIMSGLSVLTVGLIAGIAGKFSFKQKKAPELKTVIDHKTDGVSGTAIFTEESDNEKQSTTIKLYKGMNIGKTETSSASSDNEETMRTIDYSTSEESDELSPTPTAPGFQHK